MSIFLSSDGLPEKFFAGATPVETDADGKPLDFHDCARLDCEGAEAAQPDATVCRSLGSIATSLDAASGSLPLPSYLQKTVSLV